jgi:hypothetical protein
MKEPNVETSSCDVMLDEIIVNKSEPITPGPPVAPILSDEERTFANAVKRYQIAHQRALLTWSDIFEIVQSLGYRKVDRPSTPHPTNGNSQNPAPPNDAGNEKPS